MSFIAQDFDKLNIITVLESRTQAIIRNPMNTRLSSDTESSFNKIKIGKIDKIETNLLPKFQTIKVLKRPP
ncbi:degenerate transposase (orf2) [Streptococcus pneumoniae]|nr:degenerate transposase (orf2) [Streptococcus pneumoniae]